MDAIDGHIWPFSWTSLVLNGQSFCANTGGSCVGIEMVLLMFEAASVIATIALPSASATDEDGGGDVVLLTFELLSG